MSTSGSWWLLLLGLVLAVALEIAGAGAPEAEAADHGTIDEAVTALDDLATAHWNEAGLEPAEEAPALTVARRLSLALTGSIPSLEEIRAIEGLPRRAAITAHLDRLLHSRRSADYLAERLARAFVGTDEGPFIVFRRRRFVHWLSDALAEGRPYDALVREMVASEGLWTDAPATNFITGHDRDPVKLTARTTRAFLGMRLDCAQCHDHPFAHWKQADFEGLAAFYGGIRQTLTGIEDSDEAFHPGGRMMMMADDAPAAVPTVPFAREALPEGGRRREQLAAWITSPDNPAFGKAIASRIWTLMVGRAPSRSGVDDIEGDMRLPGLLDHLAYDFVGHGHDLRRLIRIIALSRPFGVAAEPDPSPRSVAFAAFPMVALRPEQIAGALVQLADLHTVDAESHVLLKLMRFGNTRDFTERYGDAGESELDEQAGTIMQRLVLMNGKVARERVEANIFTAAGRIAGLAQSDERRLDTLFTVSLSRLPSEAERALFASWLAGAKGEGRMKAMEDVLWTLVNSTEFSWSH
ncbi:MAG: DUF1549 domain-containing protein [Myxococcales bacterium]|nr:DUF1549 domain-containing protein [Myxococcales bacterium]